MDDRESRTKVGRVVVLNGPSSAGKTTIATATRTLMGANTMVVSVDQFYACAHAEAPNDWRMFRSLSATTLAAAAVLAGEGFDVVVEMVFERPELLALTRSSFSGSQLSLVAVVCGLETLEERERARGDRTLGLARRQHTRVLQDAQYDLILDTDTVPVAECARLVAERLRPATAHGPP